MCFIVYGCSHATEAVMRNRDRDHMAHRAKNSYYWPFIQKKGPKPVDFVALTSGSGFERRHLCF